MDASKYEYAALEWKLLSYREPKVIRELGEFRLYSIAFRRLGPEKIRGGLEKRARSVVNYWMKMLGSKLGRPRGTGHPKAKLIPPARLAWMDATVLSKAGLNTRQIEVFYAVARHHGNRSAAARELKVKPQAVHKTYKKIDSALERLSNGRYSRQKFRRALKD